MPDRELLIEIGCEELPAAWLPALGEQFGQRLEARLGEHRLAIDSPVETYSTPRRLTVHVAKVAERQTDLEETLTGPPVAAAFRPDGQPTAAALGFARKHGVEVPDLTRTDTPKGVYLSYRRRQRGKAAADVLPDVLGGTLRDMVLPRQMRWDAALDDGRGEFVFGRPIRWILFLYGGRVIPFIIRRSRLAEGPHVQEVRTGSVTYGHRFLATSGRAGRAVKVKTFADYKARLLEHFVVLDRAERHARIARELDVQARRLDGWVCAAGGQSTLLLEVPDLVEYPSVIAGTFAPDFLNLPPEVLTTTMIHHQHFFPVGDDAGRLKPAFLAVVNTEPDDNRTIARNAERVLTARLRDARFFWEADRKMPLESRLGRLDTLVFHRKVGSYREKAGRLERLAGWIAELAFSRPEHAEHARRAGRLAKADLATEMVGELPELQGVMGGIYAREEGAPEQVWQAIYHHYLPTSVEPGAVPKRTDLGAAAVTWAALALADKLDTVAALFAAGERPTGSRDPFGLRRQASGVLRILTDLPELTGIDKELSLGHLLEEASKPFVGLSADVGPDFSALAFWLERLSYLLEQRGFDIRNVRAVTRGREGSRPPSGERLYDVDVHYLRPLKFRRLLEVLPEFTATPQFLQLATAFKRVRNIARELPEEQFDRAERDEPDLSSLLVEPAERALLAEIDRRQPIIEDVLASGENYRRAFAEAAAFGPSVDRFFTEVFVMVDEVRLKVARLRLMKRLENLILRLADVSEIVPEA